MDKIENIVTSTFEQVARNTESLTEINFQFKRIDKKFEALNNHILEREADVRLLLEKWGYKNLCQESSLDTNFICS